MNNKTNLHIALAAALLLTFGTGCASIVPKSPKPDPAPDIKVPPKVDVDAEPAATADESSAPSPSPTVSTPKPALKRVAQPENAGLLSKTPVVQPPSAKPDGSLTRLDEMKKQGTMSEEAYGEIKRQILENPE